MALLDQTLHYFSCLDSNWLLIRSLKFSRCSICITSKINFLWKFYLRNKPKKYQSSVDSTIGVSAMRILNGKERKKKKKKKETNFCLPKRFLARSHLSFIKVSTHMLFRKSLNATRVLADASIYSGTLYLARRDLEWFQNTLTIVRNVTRLQRKLYSITGANYRHELQTIQIS